MAERKGKFASDFEAILYFLCSVEWANESTGNIPDFGRYIWRISNAPADVQMQNTEFTSVIEDFLAEEEITDSAELRASLEGHYLVTENSDGVISIQQFASESELIAAFRVWEDMYGRFFSSDTDA